MKLINNDFIKEVSKDIGIEPAIVYAFDKIESNGCGFYLNDGKWKNELKVLFEGHYFYKFTQGKFSKQRPDLSYPKWIKGVTTKFYRKGQEEFTRFMEALKLDKKAALLSTSFGRYQICGFNYEKVGYDSIEEMVTAFYEGGEPEQFLAFINFLKNTKSRLYNKSIFEVLKDYSATKNSKFLVEVIGLYNGKGQIEYYRDKFLVHYGEGYRIFKD